MTKWRFFDISVQKPYLCCTMEESKLNWYALKVFYGKVFELEAELEAMGLETYIPVRKVQLKGEEHLRAARRLATPDDRRHDN